MARLIYTSQHHRTRSILPNTRQTFTPVNDWDFKNRYPSETEPLHAAGPPDDPDESTERIIDATEDGDYTAVRKYATGTP